MPRANRRFTLAAGVSALALLISLLGLVGNLIHLQSLTVKDDVTISNGIMMTHYHSSRGMGPTKQHSGESQTSPRVPETHGLRRILQQSIASLEACAPEHKDSRRRHLLSTQEQQHDNDHNRRISQQAQKPHLPYSGIVNALTSHLSAGDRNATTCRFPPPTACHIKNYSVLVTSTGTNLRVLFLNLMVLLTYSSASELVVELARGFSQSTPEEIAKYGNRLLSWDRDDKHKVKLVLSNKQNLIQKLNEPNLFESEAIVWIDGDVSWEGNGRGVESGFELWKRHPQSLVASGGWRVRIHQEAATPRDGVGGDDKPSWLDRSELVERAWVLEEEQELDAMSRGSGVKSVTNTPADFLPTCPGWLLSLDGYDYDNVQLVDISGLFFHRDFLCFMQHPVFESFRKYVASKKDAFTERLGIGIALTQLSGRLPRLYPRTVRSDSDDNTGSSSDDDAGLYPRTVRSGSGDTGSGSDDDKGSDIDDTPPKTRSMREIIESPHTATKSLMDTVEAIMNPTEVQHKAAIRAKKKPLGEPLFKERHRKLLPGEPSTPEIPTIDEDTLTNIVGYFGNIVPGSIGWCLGSAAHRVRGYECAPTNNVNIGMIPWMNPGGFGHDLCKGRASKV